MKSKVYNYIREKLLRQDWVSGHPISHREISKETGIGFTPTREAINQLVTEGLLECHPQRGTFVSHVAREDLADLYDVREAIECHALQKIIESGVCDHESLKNCNATFEQLLEEVRTTSDQQRLNGIREAWSNADVQFHKMLLILSGNRLAINIVQELRDKTRIFGHRASLAPEDLETIFKDHRRIIEALRADDTESACREMRQHLRRGCRIALASYDRNRLLTAAGN